jgi:hypothetical protein
MKKFNWIWIAISGFIIKANDILDFIEKIHLKDLNMHEILEGIQILGNIGFWVLLIYIAYQLFRFEKHLHSWNKLDPESIIISHRANQVSTILLKSFLLSSVKEDDLVEKLYEDSNLKGYNIIDLQIVGIPQSIIDKLQIKIKEQEILILKEQIQKNDEHLATP